MRLLTKEITNKFQRTGSQEGKGNEAVVIAKFFDPCGSWTWYATEYDGDDTFFGLVDGFELEWGYFSLHELATVRGRLGLCMERDMHFGHPMIKDVRGLKGRV
jgi:hypothetical protein